MTQFRVFSSSQGLTPAVRNIDADAPNEMRQELVDVIFSICEADEGAHISSRRIYEISQQSIGMGIAANPYGGYRYAVGRDIRAIQWQRVYDLITRLWPEFIRADLQDQYRESVNRILAGYGVVWELQADGHLRRVVPLAAQSQIEAAIQELRQPRFEAASRLFNDARDAYDDRPRRDRDSCKNIFDALESIAKEVFSMPKATFGAVITHLRQSQVMQPQIIGVLDAINILRNRVFGHGITSTFDLTPAEVDFTYLSCIGGILLFARKQ